MTESRTTPASPPPAAGAAPGFKRPESVLVVVHTAECVLLLRRADHPGFWQSVTGSMHWDETRPAQTAARELAEETGLRVAPERLRDWQLTRCYTIFPEWRHRYAPGTLRNTEHLFSIEVPPDAAISLNQAEHTEYDWVPFAEAAARAFSWTNRAAIEALAAERGARPVRPDPAA